MTNLFIMRPSTNYDYKHNDMKWTLTYLGDDDEDDGKMLMDVYM